MPAAQMICQTNDILRPIHEPMMRLATGQTEPEPVYRDHAHAKTGGNIFPVQAAELDP